MSAISTSAVWEFIKVFRWAFVFFNIVSVLPNRFGVKFWHKVWNKAARSCNFLCSIGKPHFLHHVTVKNGRAFSAAKIRNDVFARMSDDCSFFTPSKIEIRHHHRLVTSASAAYSAVDRLTLFGDCWHISASFVFDSES